MSSQRRDPGPRVPKLTLSLSGDGVVGSCGPQLLSSSLNGTGACLNPWKIKYSNSQGPKHTAPFVLTKIKLGPFQPSKQTHTDDSAIFVHM